MSFTTGDDGGVVDPFDRLGMDEGMELLNQAGFGGFISQVGGGGTQEQSEFLGIPDEAIRARVGDRVFIDAPGEGPGLHAPIPGRREVRWKKEDIFDLLAGGTQRILEQQERLVRAGLLKEGEYTPGILDGETQEQQGFLLGLANLSGEDPNALLFRLSGLEESRREKLREKAARRAATQFLRADPAAIRSRVRRDITDLIGREPTQEEISEVASHFRQFESEDLTQQQNLARRRVDFELGEVDELPIETDVDPVARLDEFLSKRFAGTIAQNRRVDEMQAGQHNVIRQVGRMAGMIGNV